MCQYQRPQKRVRNPDPILAPESRQFSFLSSEFSESSNRNKTVEKTSLGKCVIYCADFELAGAADQQAGKQETTTIVRTRAVAHCSNVRKSFPAVEALCPRQRFRALSPKTDSAFARNFETFTTKLETPSCNLTSTKLFQSANKLSRRLGTHNQSEASHSDFFFTRS